MLSLFMLNLYAADDAVTKRTSDLIITTVATPPVARSKVTRGASASETQKLAVTPVSLAAQVPSDADISLRKDDVSEPQQSLFDQLLSFKSQKVPDSKKSRSDPFMDTLSSAGYKEVFEAIQACRSREQGVRELPTEIVEIKAALESKRDGLRREWMKVAAAATASPVDQREQQYLIECLDSALDPRPTWKGTFWGDNFNAWSSESLNQALLYLNSLDPAKVPDQDTYTALVSDLNEKIAAIAAIATEKRRALIARASQVMQDSKMFDGIDRERDSLRAQVSQQESDVKHFHAQALREAEQLEALRMQMAREQESFQSQMNVLRKDYEQRLATLKETISSVVDVAAVPMEKFSEKTANPLSHDQAVTVLKGMLAKCDINIDAILGTAQVAPAAAVAAA